jgi:hypothetical protein
MSGRKYTWANMREKPRYEKLDRILMATEWEQKFSLSTVLALTRDISDHTPLSLATCQALPLVAIILCSNLNYGGYKRKFHRNGPVDLFT